MLSLIVAMDPKQGIGLNGFLPWRIKEDLQLFKQATVNHKIIMGQTTFMGLPKALPNRHTIVVTTNKEFTLDIENVSVEYDLIDLLKRYEYSDEEVFVCGGSSIYKQSLPYVNRLCISHVKKEYTVDAWFPEFDWKQFEKVKEVEYEEFVYCEYIRKEDVK